MVEIDFLCDKKMKLFDMEYCFIFLYGQNMCVCKNSLYICRVSFYIDVSKNDNKLI